MRIPEPTHPLLNVDRLVKHYEGSILLDQISFTVGQNEILCLLGPSGSGKSTLLRIIAGLEPFEGGRITWEEKDIVSVPTEKRNFGLMFQDYALFPHLNVFENVAFGLRMLRLNKEEIVKRVDAMLSKVHMREFSNRRVATLSGGEQQRIALARTLAPQPQLIMLDEPLGALDKNLREELAKEIRQILHQTGIPAIYVTHDQDEAFMLADRILILDKCKIAQIGSPEDLYQFPASSRVSHFLGLGNILQGHVLEMEPFTVSTPLGQISLKAAVNQKRRGSRILLLLRPDGIVLARKGQTRFKALVKDCYFLDGKYRTHLSVGPHSILIVLSEKIETGVEMEFQVKTGAISVLEQ